MAAPTPTARGTPTGIMMKDGFRALITFANAPTIQLWEKTVTPPGVDGGDKIDTTTMHNVTYRTFEPRQLLTLTPGGATCGYDAGALSTIMSQVNRKTTITWRFTDGTTWAIYGFIKSFTPQEQSEGAVPEAQVEIEPTNWDDANDVEAGPAIASVSGT